MIPITFGRRRGRTWRHQRQRNGPDRIIQQWSNLIEHIRARGKVAALHRRLPR